MAPDFGCYSSQLLAPARGDVRKWTILEWITAPLTGAGRGKGEPAKVSNSNIIPLTRKRHFALGHIDTHRDVAVPSSSVVYPR